MKYKAIFSNLNGTINTEVEDLIESSSDYFYPIIIDGVIIETDGFEELSIDNPEQYSENQLTRFDYDIQYPYKDKAKKLLVLKNYQLKTLIPIHILEIKSGKRIETEIQITMTRNEKSVKRACSLLGVISENFDMEVAFGEVQSKLAACYRMETCSNCKNSFWNPYGGSDFFNQLCFKKEAKAFQAIQDKDKMAVVHFMKYDDDKNFQNVRLTDYCEKFEPR
ncbi:MAG: DUF6304 family protein [Tannerella sp.]|nr:DUF6304 family protein [Tannerella sp.]